MIPINELPRALRENLNSAMLDAVMAVAQERHGYLAQMREALESGDDEKLKLYARKLCGLETASAQKKKRAPKIARTKR